MSDPDDQPGQHRGGWLNAVPWGLQQRNQWIVLDGAKPIRPPTAWNTPCRQMSCERAIEFTKGTGWEMGFVFRREDPYVIIDLDDIGPLDELSDTILEWVRDFDTYTEISRSGEGLHLICAGAKLQDRQAKGQLDGAGTVEVYDNNQYIMITGDRIDTSPSINPGGDLLYDIQRTYLPERTDTTEQMSSTSKSPGDVDIEEISTERLSLTPIDIRRTIQEYASGGMKNAPRALRLWESRPENTCGRSSPSEADLALCSDLAYWCREDAVLMDECFRKSSRYRDKWDEKHYADGRTYGEGTIQKAIRTNGQMYSSDRYVVWE